MAPEQLAEPREVTAASDVYALGVTWFELLTGTVLTPQHFAAQKLPDIPSWPQAREWILRMTNFDAAARPTVASLLEIVRGWLTGGGSIKG